MEFEFRMGKMEDIEVVTIAVCGVAQADSDRSVGVPDGLLWPEVLMANAFAIKVVSWRVRRVVPQLSDDYRRVAIERGGRGISHATHR